MKYETVDDIIKCVWWNKKECNKLFDFINERKIVEPKLKRKLINIILDLEMKPSQFIKRINKI